MKFSRISEKNTPNDTFISILYYNEVERKVLPDSNKKQPKIAQNKLANLEEV